jgi:hypothetical protein
VALQSASSKTRRSFLSACSAAGLGALCLNILGESCGKGKKAISAGLARAYAEALLNRVREVHERELPTILRASQLAIQAKLEGHDLYAWMTGGMFAGEMSDTRPGSPLIYLKTDIRHAVRYDFVVTNDSYAVKGFSERLVRIIGITKPSILNNETPRDSLENMGTFRLEDVADIVLYSHVPPADGILDVNGIDYPIGPASGIIETVLFYALTVEIAEGLIKEGVYPRIG